MAKSVQFAFVYFVQLYMFESTNVKYVLLELLINLNWR